MSDIDTSRKDSFISKVPPGPVQDKTTEEIKEDIQKERQENLNDSILNAQEKIYKGLSTTMSDITLENMQKLAPQDEFTIQINGKDKTYQRNKLKPKQIKELRQAARIYAEDVKLMEDPDLRLDRDHQLLAFKAKLYLDMTDDEFENCDVEYLSQVIQATELRTQGFRKC
jgi:hypothetical protein